jgi:YbbR domain-containing protein
MKLKTHLALIILVMILAFSSVNAKEVTMKTNDIYTAHFEVENENNGGELRDCIPYFSKDLKDQPFVILEPKQFNLNWGEKQTIMVSFQNPETGFYQDEINVRCVKYLEGEFVGAEDILSNPQNFELIVKISGEGQAYSINPTNKYFFYSKPPSEETATFQIANIGTTELDVNFQIPSDALNVKITPIRITIPEGKSQVFTVKVTTDQNFKDMKAEIPINIGDFKDVFIVEGEKETITSVGGAAVTSIAFGDVEVNGFKIPRWVIIILLVGAGYVIYKEQNKREK